MKKASNFAYDLKFGQEGEKSVHNVLSIETVEVKRDSKWFDTGNLYIETECYMMSSGKYEPSGLSKTEATHWAFSLDDLTVIVPTETLRTVVSRAGRSIVCNIPPNPSRGFLITLKDISDYIKETHNG